MDTPAITVAELWRYPVKGMQGDPLQTAEIEPNGFVGDRRFAIESAGAPRGKPLLTGAERAHMLLFSAAAENGDVLVTAPTGEQFRIDDPALLRHMQQVLPGSHELSLRHSSTPLTDVRPIAILGTETVAQLTHEHGTAVDARRFRANILLHTHEGGWSEDALVGRHIAIGTAILFITERDPRCRIVTLDPATAQPDPDLMKLLDRQHQGRVGIYATVVTPGTIRVGDAVNLLSATTPSAANRRPTL